MHRFSSFLFPFLFLLLLVTASSSSLSSDEFLNTLETTIDAIGQVTSVVSQFTNLLGDSRLSNAISDCLDLFDASADQLQWSASAARYPNGTHYMMMSTGDLSSDLQTWIGAAMANIDTCLDGFQGTTGIAKRLVSGSLAPVTSLFRGLLSSVHHRHASPNRVRFPSRVEAELDEVVTPPDVTVAADGTGDFTTVTEAVEAAPEKSLNRFVIYVKSGFYLENVEIKKKKWNIMMVGDGIDATVISGNRSYADGWTTFRSATFAVSGRGFMARDMTFENTAGPEKHQAVALRSDSDLAVFFRCGVRGYQDTLYTHTMGQFFRDCQISGTVDFIFGDAAAVFQNCQIIARKGLPAQKNTITSQGRKYPDQPTGFCIQFCNITAEDGPNPAATYLGRPWKQYSRTVVMQSYISDAVRPEGWLEWNRAGFALDTLVYAEYMNCGPGVGLWSRVNWPGYRILKGPYEANNYTVGQFIEGDSWLPYTGVDYVSGLSI